MKWMAAIVGALASASVTGAGAQENFSAGFEALLVEGRLEAAEEYAQSRLGVASDSAEAGFALGLTQFLMAVEELGHGLYRYGLATSYGNPAADAFGGGMPFLRIPLPENPSPEPVTYAGLRSVLDRFVRDLAEAEATLAAVPDAAFELPLQVPMIRLDFDRDGVGAPTESVGALFLAVTGVDIVSPEWAAWREDVAAGSVPPFGLDESDVPWLQGYCHLLSALGDFVLAHDWEDAFDATFHSAFPATLSAGLAAEDRRLLDTLGPEPPHLTYDQEGYDEWVASPEGQVYWEWESRRSASELAGIADLVAFLHLMRWPVVEPARMASAREHLLSMVSLSRENWRRILAETDDNREWVPGPRQTVLFDNMRITDETVFGWRLFLDAFEAVLEGERLLPHWRVAKGRGINLRRMFEEPRTFDPWLIAQGSAIMPYLEDGQTVSYDTVFTMVELTDGGLLGYFLWFN